MLIFIRMSLTNFVSNVHALATIQTCNLMQFSRYPRNVNYVSNAMGEATSKLQIVDVTDITDITGVRK